VSPQTVIQEAGKLLALLRQLKTRLGGTRDSSDVDGVIPLA
jgi:hypothetical protein